MQVPRPIPFSPLLHVLVLLYTVGQLYSAIAIPYASFPYANNATDLCLSAALTSSGNRVFINYHQPDVGKTFASHLSHSIVSNGLRSVTIETASVCIAIFSKNYAKCSRCLNELRHMSKSGVPNIPVFYDVKPSDLQCQVMYAPVLRMSRWTTVKNGSLYCEDLRMLEEEKADDPQTCQERPQYDLNTITDPQTCQDRPQYDLNTITEWRKALLDAKGIGGFELAIYNGDEGRLVHDIVKLSIKGVSKTRILYDVFLNHRGKDVKKTFANQLYYRLRHYGLQVFYDKEELRKGNRIKSEIENAIKVASVHIAIFSKGYAESEWCMDELLLMVESDAIIIPVFYDVKPTDIWWNRVDGMDGVYAEALRILKEQKTFDPETRQEKPRYDTHTIEIWKDALMEVTGRDGFELETYDGDEGQLLDVIVREVQTKVKKDKAKLLTEPCQKNNPSSSERERYQVVGDPDSKRTCRQSSYERKDSFYY